ncbi:MAG: ATP-binding protein [Candidatus Brocadia sinica]|nr:ATP-binding protein [Candidatus Brocadia sinica]NUO06674.1 AAA family ATPase [Candidatus Brocadia sinica]
MFINEIRIRNFRSIIDRRIKLSDFTIFVGNNDVGKSNVLKALNLFFNGKTEHGVEFNFDKDYCFFAKKRARKAEEIEITLYFTVPSNFKDAGKKAYWIKKWRVSGEHKQGEAIHWANGGALGGKNKVGSWLRKIDFRYVPAIKSDAYFSDLLSQMYKIFSKTIEKDIEDASQSFVDKIRDHTKMLSKEIESTLGFSSRLQLPENLSELFETLDFETQIGKKDLSLRRRGDGIKVRHIPAMLKFLADKERTHHIKGDARQDTIWGYEEPENNVEFRAAFDLAETFIQYNKQIQILMTTHSPVFYNLQHDSHKITKYYTNTTGSDEHKETDFQLIDNSSANRCDDLMGFMPLIAPHVEKMKIQYDRANEENQLLIKQLEEDRTSPVVFVEGITDKEILEVAWKKLFQSKEMPFLVKDAFDCYFIVNTFRRGEIHSNYPARKFLGMLDFDGVFEEWKRIEDKMKNDWTRLDGGENKGLCLKKNNKQVWLFLLPVPEHRQDYANESYGKRSCLTIELLFDDSVVKDYCEEISQPGGGKVFKIKEDKKRNFANYVPTLDSSCFESFRPIFSRIEEIINGAIS